MRICYLSNSAIPSSVASAIQTVKMCEAFSELNNDVILITTNASKLEKNINDFYNIKFKFIFKKLKNFESFPLGINFYLFSFFSILESLKYKPDIYITRNFFTCFLLVIFKKKVIMELHHDLNIESRITRFLVKKLKYLNSKEAQTGPALRKDIKTLKKHLNLLKGTSYHKIYETISNEIKKIKYEL